MNRIKFKRPNGEAGVRYCSQSKQAFWRGQADTPARVKGRLVKAGRVLTGKRQA